MWWWPKQQPVESDSESFYVHCPRDSREPNHLVPVCLSLPEYRERIRQHLLLTPCHHGLVICCPAFEPEWALSVYDRFVAGFQQGYFVTLTTATANLFHITDSVPVNRIDLPIPCELAVAIQRAWAQMLLHTKYSQSGYGGLDGCSWEFGVFIKYLGDFHGETWSPSAGLPATMVNLAVKLTQQIQATDPFEPETCTKLMHELRQFERTAAQSG